MNCSARLRSLSRAVAAALIMVAGMTGILAVAIPTSPAAADPPGACTTTTGEIVVVDLTPWPGGQIERGCDPTLTTGLAALQAAGFTTAGDQHDGPAFICRIDDDPPPSQDPCINTPPATAYWSYWHADAGQDVWSYSQLGAATYRPQPGSVDAWVFGSANQQGTNGQPSFSPAEVRATNVTPTVVPPPTVSTTAPLSASSPTTSPSAPPATTPPTTAPSSTPSTSTSPSTATTTTTTNAPSGVATSGKSGGGRAPEPKIVDAVPVADRGPGAGSPVPFVVGGIVVVMMLGVAGFLTWRRRHPGPTVEG
jgi:hypothetical protein